MRNLTIILIFALSSCLGHIPKAKEQKVLYGTWKGNEYENKYFDIKLNLSQNWKTSPAKFLNVFSPHLLESDYYFPDDTLNAVVSLNITADKVNPFDNETTVTKTLQENIEALRFLYDENEMIVEDFKDVKFKNQKFKLSRVIFLEDGDSTFLDEYLTFKKKYFLSITLSYRSKLNENLTNEILKQLK